MGSAGSVRFGLNDFDYADVIVYRISASEDRFKVIAAQHEHTYIRIIYQDIKIANV